MFRILGYMLILIYLADLAIMISGKGFYMVKYFWEKIVIIIMIWLILFVSSCGPDLSKVKLQCSLTDDPNTIDCYIVGIDE